MILEGIQKKSDLNLRKDFGIKQKERHSRRPVCEGKYQEEEEKKVKVKIFTKCHDMVKKDRQGWTGQFGCIIVKPSLEECCIYFDILIT